MFRWSSHSRGFTLVELVLAIVILSTVLLYLLRVFAPATESTTDMRQRAQLSLYLQDQTTYIQSMGFWVWTGDTASANNAAHPISVWQSRLSEWGYSGRAQMAVTFLTDSGGSLLPFATMPFDGESPRDKVQVTLTLFTSENHPVTESFYLMLAPTEKICWATLHILKRALLMYAADHGGSYPATASWAAALVGSYVDEIPNDPFTTTLPKVTHQEEVVDWFYENNAGTVTLASNVKRSTVVSVFF